MQYTYVKNDDFPLIDEGMYEVAIDKAKEAINETSGKKRIQLTFRIREDVEQEHQGRLIFESIWQEKDSEYYNRRRINQLLGTQKIEDGQTFNGVDEILEFLQGKILKVKVKLYFDEYYGKDMNRVAYYSSTDHPYNSLDAKPIDPVATASPTELKKIEENSTTIKAPADISVDEEMMKMLGL